LAQGREPKVYTIAPGTPFADALALGIVQTVGDAPEALSTVRVLLPTRRACRTLREAFLRLSDGKPLLLPRMTPLGDVDEDELALTASEEPTSDAALSIPPAIGGLRRQMLLARLILAVPGEARTPDQAVRLAAELARLLDQIHTERLDFSDLKNLVPDAYASHWQITLDFLKILVDAWPRVLAEEGVIDPADRRNRLLAAQVDQWRTNPPATPVIAAGSTGSIPATADLLSAVSRLPRGAVVLPGFDTHLDEKSRAALEPTHPQFGMNRLLETLQVSPAEVGPWPATPEVTAPVAKTRQERGRLMAETMRPSQTGEEWRAVAIDPAALDGLRRIDCPTPKEEAGVIALLARETLEHKGRTAALITPDRNLARRVAAELERWNIEIDDSAGQPLSKTPAGTFLRLSAHLAAGGFAPLDLLSTLKHPKAALGFEPADLRRRTRRLEIDVLRGPRPESGLAGLKAALPATEKSLIQLADRLAEAGVAIETLMGKAVAEPRDLVRAHIAFAEALAASAAETGSDRLWTGDDGEQAGQFMASLLEAMEGLPAMTGRLYPDMLESLMETQVVRPHYGGHPRLAVWGLLEARLQSVDLVILGGLNEGVWPPETQASPWMSRPMMKDFGLPTPERRIGLTAHDFVQAACNAQVVCTRSGRADGAPTVPSRWLMRLDTLLKGAGLEENLATGGPWLDWLGKLDAPNAVRPIDRPAPTPPLAARPRELSVTRIETWMRDPYALYAEKILKLRALDPLDADPGAADYGTLVHDALDAFCRAYPDALPKNALERLITLGKEQFAPHLSRPGVWAFWWPRFERIAHWFIETETARRGGLKEIHTEVSGRYSFNAKGGPFTLTAKADRIDRLTDGGYLLIDYKTGAPPSAKEVEAGFAPQLPLEAVILENDGFEGLANGPVGHLEYWQLKGSSPVGKITPATRKKPVEEVVKEALEGVAHLVSRFDDPATPYESRPVPDMAPKYSDYEHLARIKEWSAGVDGGEDGG